MKSLIDNIRRYFSKRAQRNAPPWFIERMMCDSWPFGLLLTTGHVAVINCINDIREDKCGDLWIDVEMRENGIYARDVALDIGKLMFSPTSRTTASIRCDQVVMAFELADT